MHSALAENERGTGSGLYITTFQPFPDFSSLNGCNKLMFPAPCSCRNPPATTLSLVRQSACANPYVNGATVTIGLLLSFTNGTIESGAMSALPICFMLYAGDCEGPSITTWLGPLVVTVTLWLAPGFGGFFIST